MKNTLILCLLILSSACASNKKHNLRESLTTEITENGSKVFQFSVFMVIEKSDLNNKDQHKGRSQQSSRNAARGSNGSSDELTQYFDKQLKNLPIIALFCRQHYFVLDRLNTKDEITVRAECHDSATSDDYIRFKSLAVPTKI